MDNFMEKVMSVIENSSKNKSMAVIKRENDKVVIEVSINEKDFLELYSTEALVQEIADRIAAEGGDDA